MQTRRSGIDQLNRSTSEAIIKHRLKTIQYRTDRLDGLLTHTGLTLEPDTT
jgi:hypothetical protein